MAKLHLQLYHRFPRSSSLEQATLSEGSIIRQRGIQFETKTTNINDSNRLCGPVHHPFKYQALDSTSTNH